MTIQELKALALHSAKGTAPETFSVENVNEALADGLRALCGSVNQFMKNRYDIYEIITAAVDAEVPNKVIDAIGMFAEVKQVAQGQKAAFKIKKGMSRAKKFITKVGLSGVYETFRLDSEVLEINPIAMGGACTLDFERMLDGEEIIADYVSILSEGLVDSVYKEVQNCLVAATASLPAANQKSGSTFSADDMLALVNIARAYGQGAVIFASPEFVAAMGPDQLVPVAANKGVHPQDLDAIHYNGYINIFRGTPVVTLPQSFEDESNAVKVINPQKAYVFPTGGEKVVKVAIEGNTQMYDATNRDNSMEIHAYRKFGAGIITYHNWGVYTNTAL